MIICIDSRIVFYFYIQVTRYADSARDESMANNNNRQVVSNLVQYENVLELSLMALMLAAVKSVIAAEDARVWQVWMAQPPNLPDVLTTFSAAAAKTSTINLGTSIVLTYPRHPLVMAQQALALHDLASGRLRLGIGPSHRFIIDNMYGLQHSKPLTHLREYSEVLLTVLWTGKVNHRGQVRKWQSVKRGFLMRQIMHWSTDDDLRKLPRFRSLVNDIKLILRPMCYLSKKLSRCKNGEDEITLEPRKYFVTLQRAPYRILF